MYNASKLFLEMCLRVTCGVFSKIFSLVSKFLSSSIELFDSSSTSSTLFEVHVAILLDILEDDAKDVEASLIFTLLYVRKI